MTLEEIKAVLVSVDPDISHFYSMKTQKDYSYWEETKRLPFTADDVHQEAWRFYVHRFTRDDMDPIAENFFTTLDNCGISVSHTKETLNDDGIIHHIFECEAY